ncbi:MAG: GDP-mannose 4,6-dehydratase, partial [Planctomycetes bacterium]|nr:GDP-mannose 4,6-dehydratase [Planctomycetota bacterium]
LRNLDAVSGHPSLDVRVGSVLDEETTTSLAARSDVVVHLAAAVGVRLIVERPVHTLETNTGGCAIVLRAAARCGAKVVAVSTSEVYGRGVRGDTTPFREDQDLVLGSPSRPRWAYACSKAFDEFLALAHHREQGLPVVIPRLFNAIGPRQVGRYGMVVPRLVDQSLAGEPLTVHGDGLQTRSFTDVRDTVEALVRLLRCDAAVGEVVNVGASQEITIDDLARRIIRLSGSSSSISHVPHAAVYGAEFDDMARRLPDTSKLEQLTGFAPRRSIDVALESVIVWRRCL